MRPRFKGDYEAADKHYSEAEKVLSIFEMFNQAAWSLMEQGSSWPPIGSL
jgi:hypothetical protein